jgi:hypothetical protein
MGNRHCCAHFGTYDGRWLGRHVLRREWCTGQRSTRVHSHWSDPHCACPHQSSITDLQSCVPASVLSYTCRHATKASSISQQGLIHSCTHRHHGRRTDAVGIMTVALTLCLHLCADRHSRSLALTGPNCDVINWGSASSPWCRNVSGCTAPPATLDTFWRNGTIMVLEASDPLHTGRNNCAPRWCAAVTCVGFWFD